MGAWIKSKSSSNSKRSSRSFIGDSLSFDATQLRPFPPAGVTLDPQTDSRQFLWQVFASNGQVVATESTTTLGFVPADNGQYTVVLTVTDRLTIDDVDYQVVANSGPLEFAANNLAPTLQQPSQQQAEEGRTFTFSGNVSDPGSGDSLFHTINWGDGSTPTEVEILTDSRDEAGMIPFTATHIYADNGVYTATIEVRDDDQDVHVRSLDVVVSNGDPSLNFVQDQVVDENSPLALTNLLVFSDAGFDNALNPAGASVETFTYSILWGDGTAADTGNATVDLVGSANTLTTGSFDGTHIYADGGIYTITITLIDDDAGTASRLFDIEVLNVGPSLTVADDQTIDEGATLNLTDIVTFTDPGFDNPNHPAGASVESFSIDIDWGDGISDDPQMATIDSMGSRNVLTTGSLDGSHTFADNGVYTVTVTVTDDDGGQGVNEFEVTVGNVAPTLTIAADQTIPVGAIVYVEDIDQFTDPGFTRQLIGTDGNEQFTYSVDWGDGSAPVTAVATVDVIGEAGIATSGSFDAKHVYAATGSYTVSVTLTDDDGAAATGSLNVDVTTASNATNAIQLSSLSLDENLTTAVIGDVVVNDPDTDAFYEFTVSDPNFSFVEGQLTFTADEGFDYETTDPISLEITAYEYDEPRLIFSQAVTISIVDVNETPTVDLINRTTVMAETTDTTNRVKVADIAVSDDGLGAEQLSLTGADAALFEIDADVLYLIAGTVLDFPTNPVLNVTLAVDDSTVGDTPDDSVDLAIHIYADVTPTITVDTAVGGGNVTVRRNGNAVEVVDNDSSLVLARQPLAETETVQINGADSADDELIIDLEFGGYFTISNGIQFDGGVDGNDLLTVLGDEQASGILLENSKTFSGRGLVSDVFENQGHVIGPDAPELLDFTGDVRGAGDFDGQILFSGTFAPGNSPALIPFASDLRFGANATLFVELGGLQPGTEFDRIEVAGTAFLDGTLEVQFINGFVPQLGDEFEVITFNGRNADFNTYSGMDIGLDLKLVPDLNDSRLILRAEPVSRPTATIATVTPDPRNIHVSEVAITFDEPVINFDISDIVLTLDGQSVDLAGLTIDGSASEYSLDLTSVTSADGEYLLSVDTAGVNNLEGYVGETVSTDSWTIDTIAPTADILDIDPDPRDAIVGLVNINFSEPVTGLTIDDLTLSLDGQPIDISGLDVGGSGANYSIDLASVSAISGQYELQLVAAGAGIRDQAGNPLAADAIDTWTSVNAQVVRLVSPIAFNASEVDPPNLAKGQQPTSWDQQRSMIRTVDMEFNVAVTPTASDFRLTNLGLNADATPDTIVDLTAANIVVSDNRVSLHFDDGLSDGVYQLEILDTLTDSSGREFDGNGDGTPGDGFVLTGNADNRFYAETAEWSGDFGVSVFDFSTFSYWFGLPVPMAPEYVDLNRDGGVSVFDFSVFASNFGLGVAFPTNFANGLGIDSEAVDTFANIDEPILDQALVRQTINLIDNQRNEIGQLDPQDVALMNVLEDWQPNDIGAPIDDDLELGSDLTIGLEENQSAESENDGLMGDTDAWL